MMCSCGQLRKWEDDSRALIFYKKLCKVDPLQLRMMYYSYFMKQKLLQVVSIEKKMQLIALVTRTNDWMQSTFI